MKNRIIYYILFLLIISCSKNSDKDISGKWEVMQHFVDNQEIKLYPCEKSGYLEFNQGIIYEYNHCQNTMLKSNYVLDGSDLKIERGVDISADYQAIITGNKIELISQTERWILIPSTNQQQLFIPPFLDFGKSKSDIVNKEPRDLETQTDNELVYRGENYVIDNVTYLFKEDKLFSVVLCLILNDEEVSEYLNTWGIMESEDFWKNNNVCAQVTETQDALLGIVKIVTFTLF